VTSPADARSPLNLRLVLAAFGAVVSFGLGVLTLRAFGLGPALFLFVLAVIAVVDLLVIQRRRRQRARAHAGSDHRHDSLFE
jgi:membrane protein implicated in regulation of membrane protease activity